MFKSIALREEDWEVICRELEATDGRPSQHRCAALLREQLSGKVKVTVSGKTIQFKAPKGGDLRDLLIK